MRKPFYLKNKRDREFQKRMLNAVEKPKLPSWWTLINSSFAIFTMSAVFITAISTAFTVHQNCIIESRANIEKYHDAKTELLYRRSYIEAAVKEAVSKNDLQNKLKNIPNHIGKFKNTSTLGIFDTVRRIENTFYKDDISDLVAEIFPTDFRRQYVEAINRKFGGLENGILGRTASNYTITEIQTFGHDVFKFNGGLRELYFRTNYLPRCNPKVLISRVIGSPSQNILAVESQYKYGLVDLIEFK